MSDPKNRGQVPTFEGKSPVSHRRPLGGDELTLFVPPPSVRAYALEHAGPGAELAAEEERASRAPCDPPVSGERTLIVSTRQVQNLARECVAEEATLVRAKPTPEVGDGSEAADLEQQMFDRVAAKEYAAAMMLADSVLALDPGNKKAQLCSDRCRVLVEHMYLKHLGSLECVPQLKVGLDELRAKALDARAGFLLSQVDGATSVEMLVDLGTLPRLETLRLLYELTVDGVIEVT